MQQQEQLLICFTTENSESNNLAELLEESFKIKFKTEFAREIQICPFKIIFLKRAITDFFFFIFDFSIQLTVNV